MGKQWAADITLTDKLVHSLVSTQFPELNCREVELIDAGWDNSVFLVNQRIVFRFPRRRVAVDLIVTENQALPWLSPQLPIATPEPMFIGEPTVGYPFPFSGYHKLHGDAPYKLNLDTQARARCSLPLAKFLRALHSVPIDAAVRRGVPRSDNIGRMDLGKRVPLLIAKIEEAHTIGLVEDSRALLASVEEVMGRKRMTPPNLAVVHGDLNFRNFLVHPDGTLAGIIDWGDIHIGNPAIDLSLIYSYLPAESRTAFLNEYGEVHPETLQLAKFRALYTNVVILIYAHDIGDAQQLRAAQTAISNALQ